MRWAGHGVGMDWWHFYIIFWSEELA